MVKAKVKDFKFDTRFQGQSGHGTLKFFEKEAWQRSRDLLNFWPLNDNSSKTVKATDFRFGVRVSRDSSDMTTLKIFQKGASVKIYLAEICTLTSAF